MQVGCEPFLSSLGGCVGENQRGCCVASRAWGANEAVTGSGATRLFGANEAQRSYRSYDTVAWWNYRVAPFDTLKRDPQSGPTDFAVSYNLIRDRAGDVYRDGKSHPWIGVAHAEEGRVDADQLAPQIDQGSS
jgi:hypothetical protein